MSCLKSVAAHSVVNTLIQMVWVLCIIVDNKSNKMTKKKKKKIKNIFFKIPAKNSQIIITNDELCVRMSLYELYHDDGHKTSVKDHENTRS